jgi:hypothetical protein
MVRRSFSSTSLHLRQRDAISLGIFWPMSDCRREANGSVEHDDGRFRFQIVVGFD